MAVPVEVAQVERGDISAFFTTTATLEAEEETDVVAKVGGVVKEIRVEEGDAVKAGQVLAKLDDEKVTMQLAQAKANLNKLENAYHRSEALFQKNLVSTEEFQKAKYEYEFQKATYDLVKLDLDYTSIRAPIDGVVSERRIKKGNMVLPNQAVFRVTGLSPLRAMLHVPEHQMNKLRKGHTAQFTVDALQDATFSGIIDRTSPVVDPLTGTVKVTVKVNDTTGRLKPGMFARIHIIYDLHTHALLVPKEALVTEDRENAVFLVKDGKALRKLVEIGYRNGTHIEIMEGIAEGDVIVTTGKGSLKDQTKVEVVTEDKGTETSG
jgi:RND family efflux transporter MFP subunit